MNEDDAHNDRRSAVADPSAPSLFRELADGTSGPVVRVLVTVAVAAMMAGAALIAAYAGASALPQWNRAFYYGGFGSGAVHPRDEVVAWMFVLAGLAYLPMVAWLWSRNTRHRALWYAGVMTAVMIGLTIGACVVADEALVGSEEIVMAGICFLSGSLMLLMWVQVWRTYGRGRAARNRDDGRLDVRCPTCGYRMVGLTECRCPECGTAYTLDELLGRQDFSRPAGTRATPALSAGTGSSASLPPLPPVPSNGMEAVGSRP